MSNEETEQHKSWNEAKRQTMNMTLREAARKAGFKFTMGFEACYLDDRRVNFRDAREIIGKTLLEKGNA